MIDEDFEYIIEELKAELKEQAMQYLSDTGQLGERIGELTEVLEATKDKLAKAVGALELADNNLTNLQPKIANGLVRSDWVPVFDGYIDPVIQAARAALTQKDTVHD